MPMIQDYDDTLEIVSSRQSKSQRKVQRNKSRSRHALRRIANTRHGVKMSEKYEHAKKAKETGKRISQDRGEKTQNKRALSGCPVLEHNWIEEEAFLDSLAYVNHSYGFGSWSFSSCWDSDSDCDFEYSKWTDWW